MIDLSNLINLGILVVTGLVGILAWLGARKAASEARKAQHDATAAAARSAASAEESVQLQHRMVEIEQQRDEIARRQSRRANLHAEIRQERATTIGSTGTDTYLIIKNTGNSEAQDILLAINGRPTTDYREFRGGDLDGRTIGAGSEAKLRFGRGRGSTLGAQFEVDIK